jgi:hypothetical protein
VTNLDTPAPDLSGLPRTIAALEEQLVELDRMRLHIGAAHVDAAIQHLRTEQARRLTL